MTNGKGKAQRGADEVQDYMEFLETPEGHIHLVQLIRDNLVSDLEEINRLEKEERSGVDIDADYLQALRDKVATLQGQIDILKDSYSAMTGAVFPSEHGSET